MKKVAIKFMKLWSKGKFAEMYGLTQKTWQNEHTVEDLKNLLESYYISYAECMNLAKITDQAGDVRLLIMTKNDKYFITKARLIKELEAINPSSNGEWGINPISILKSFKEIPKGQIVKSKPKFRLFSRS